MLTNGMVIVILTVILAVSGIAYSFRKMNDEIEELKSYSKKLHQERAINRVRQNKK